MILFCAAVISLSACSSSGFSEGLSDSVITAGPDIIVSEPAVSETVSETTAVPEPEEKSFSEITADSMSLHEKICQLFIVTPEQLTEAYGAGGSTVYSFDETASSALKAFPVAGLIYFAGNLSDRQQIIDMNRGFTSASKYGLFISVDEEGGEVARLSSKEIEGITALNSMAWYGEQENAAEQFSEVGRTLGSELYSLGFNLDFAPVADIEIDPDHTMGRRMAGSDPEYVGDLIASEVNAMQKEKVCSTLKHFPGLGATYADTHYGNAVLSRSYEELTAAEFIPFRKGIEAGAEFIMVSHAVAEGLGESVPSDLSYHVTTDILRNDLGFNGIIITDAHSGMASITDYYSSEEASVAALRAGADIILSPEDLQASVSAIEQACAEDESLCSRIDESVRRILEVKFRYGIIGNSLPADITAEES